MPHFVIDCSESILKKMNPKELMEQVFEMAFLTGLFTRKAIKVRINPFKYFYSEKNNEDFIHVFASIMEGRSAMQKQLLSAQIVTKLNALFPEVNIISMNIIDIEKETYCNKTMILDEK